MDDDDWDLQAVVRGCGLTGPAAATRDPFSSFPPWNLKAEEPPDGDETGFPDLQAARSARPELEELCHPFIPKPLLSPLWRNPDPAASIPQPPRPLHRPPSQISRLKRRKNQQKRVVCHVAADGASPDMWAWRKYGQKPIKGSPYPRGYYRCSSLKGCLARKQVERSRTDPAVLVITYTAEHNHPLPTHRNSLAGSTRHKLTSSAASTTSTSTSDHYPPPENPSDSPPSSSTAAGLSPTTPLTASMEDELLRRRRPQKGGEEEDEEDDDEDEDDGVLLVEDMEVMGEDDLLFTGEDEVYGTTSAAAASAAVAAFAADFFDDDGGFEEHFFHPWLANNSSSKNNAASATGGS